MLRLRIALWLVASIFVPPLFHGTTAHAQNPPAMSAAADLSAAERSWLAGNHTVRARVADYPPYMLAQPTPAGMAVDYLSAIARRYGFKVEFIPDSTGFAAAVKDVMGPRQHYDMMLTFTRTPEREKQFAITADYLSAPWVVYARRDSPYILGLESLNDKTVAAEKGYVITGKIQSDYPKIRLLEVAKSEDALLAVATGRADAYVGNLANASYFIKARRFDNLVVTAPTDYGINTQAMAVRNDWPELAGIISKGIAAMTAEERNAISHKWGTMEFKPRIDYALVWQIVAASLLVFAFFFYWNRKLAKEIANTRRVEGELRISRDIAESASRAKSTFLANMSHELRTPMNAIMGMTGLALRHTGDPELRDQLGKIDSASRHLLAVINDILDISKIEAERLTLENIDFRIGEVLENLALLIALKAEEKGLAWNIDLPPEIASLPLRGDPLRLGQILLNYTANAVKFTERGSITVRVRLVEESPESLLLRSEVVDTGIGIASEDQQRLFTAFEQADGSMTRKHGGTGLGLAISRQLAKLMGGEAGVISQPGTGSTFWFTARFAKAPPGSAGAVAPASTFPGKSADEQLLDEYAGARILLAEDEPINQEVARGLLEDAGLIVDLAADGAIAVALARQNAYALIVMDMQMPQLNGIEATMAIRADSLNRATPILAMTANAFDEDRQRCIVAGMNDHIAKPVNPEILYASLLQWLRQSRAAGL